MGQAPRTPGMLLHKIKCAEGRWAKKEPKQRHLSDFVSNDISKKSMGLQKLKAKIYYYNFGSLLPNGYYTSCLYGV